MNKTHFDTFNDFYVNAPPKIKDYIDKCKNTPQSPEWHPESDVYTHIKIVFNRAKRYSDINLMLAAIFHDLGKVDTTKPHFTIPGKITSKFHEIVSCELIKENREWIESFGADYDIIYYIVAMHMRIKNIDEMRPFKRDALKKHKYFSQLERFTRFDDMKIDYSHDINE
jgi:hypothetical protein